MRISSAGELPRLDLDALRRFVPPLWQEWAELRFDPAGWLLDADTGAALPRMRLIGGRHRQPGAAYLLADGSRHCTFTLASDDRRTVAGTFTGEHWKLDVTIGERCSASGRLDVGAVLRANQTPGCLVALIGGRPATGELQVDPTALDREGQLATGRARAQRAGAAGHVHVAATPAAWRLEITLDLHGRGLGRVALLLGRPWVRKALSQGLTEFWTDTAKDFGSFATQLAHLDAQAEAAGGHAALLHRELWRALREPAE